MAITTKALNKVDKAQAVALNTQWRVNFSSADASGGEIIKADPGAGLSLVITKMVLVYGIAGSITITEDATTILGPFTFVATAGGTLTLDFSDEPLILTANTELGITADAGAIAGVVDGYTTI